MVLHETRKVPRLSLSPTGVTVASTRLPQIVKGAEMEAKGLNTVWAKRADFSVRDVSRARPLAVWDKVCC